ncbi:hypothetical protein BKA65DRAFT_501392 [Rhexocercosporidium sp. MPI-PUGE-AT-0058]|nr:hypothetical protein BKA65DRAFT_501392 [Rhexocercosporidium sp. MPI-PUGE-AT-0058]
MLLLSLFYSSPFFIIPSTFLSTAPGSDFISRVTIQWYVLQYDFLPTLPPTSPLCHLPFPRFHFPLPKPQNATLPRLRVFDWCPKRCGYFIQIPCRQPCLTVRLS